MPRYLLPLWFFSLLKSILLDLWQMSAITPEIFVSRLTYLSIKFISSWNFICASCDITRFSCVEEKSDEFLIRGWKLYLNSVWQVNNDSLRTIESIRGKLILLASRSFTNNNNPAGSNIGRKLEQENGKTNLAFLASNGTCRFCSVTTRLVDAFEFHCSLCSV